MAVKKKVEPILIGKKVWFLSANATLREGRIQSVKDKKATIKAINMKIGTTEEQIIELPLDKIHMSND